MKNVYIFLAGALCGGLVVFLIVTRHVVPVVEHAPSTARAPPPVATAPPVSPPASTASVPARSERPSPPPQASAAPIGPLTSPVAGVDASQLSDTFAQSRAAGRPHEAIDIMAPRGTAVIAVADGKVAKLFTSKPGGLTVYQFDTTEKLAYYYAHLDRYAAGLAEGQVLKRGDLVGYVGSSGNADPAHPHLHFAIFELGPEKHWWEGRAINPYPLLAGEASAPR